MEALDMTNHMEALKFNPCERLLTLVETEIPKLERDDEVLIRVVYSGVCGTDLHILQGNYPCRKDAPVTLGHEFCGQVAKVGKNVTTLKVNDRVVVDPYKGCHKCVYCHSGKPHFCDNINDFVLGMFRDGGFATYCLAPEEQILKLPDTITFEQAGLCEPLSCLAHGWDRLMPVTVGQKILIIGAGIIGNLLAIYFHLHGHRRVTISEPNEERLKQIEKLNIDFDLITPDKLKLRQTNDPNYNYDLIVDCSGFGPAIEYAVTLLDKGGKLVLFGVAPPTTKISISPYDFFAKEKAILGTKTNPYSYPKAIGLLEAFGDRYLNYENLGIKVFKLSEYEEAFSQLKKGTISKAMFKL